MLNFYSRLMKSVLPLAMLLLGFHTTVGQPLYPFLDQNGRWGFVDENSSMVITPAYDYAHPFIEGVAAVQRGELWGFINSEGMSVTRFKFVDLGETSEGLIPVADLGYRWGMINLKGKVVIPHRYENLGAMRYGAAPAAINRTYGFLNEKGDWIIQPQYTHASEFNRDGFASVSVSLTEGYVIDTLGEKHDYISSSVYGLPNEGVYAKQSEENYKWGFYDLRTKENIIPHAYNYVYPFGSGLAPVNKEGKWGFVDRDNNVKIPFTFDDTGSFIDGVAVVKVGDKKGYINVEGEYIIEPIFDLASNFHNGVGEVEVNEVYFYVNKKGELLLQE